jgi:hypothetical protein
VRAHLALVALAVALVAACTGGDDSGGDVEEARDDSGCPVAAARVGELLDYEVTVDKDTASAASCRFLPAESVAADHPGAHVLVVERRLAGGDDGESGYDAALSAVEDEVGSARSLAEGEVDGAERGWVAGLGRVVQVGAAAGSRLVQVTVADGTLDAAAARDVAIDLAGDVLG